MKPPTEIELLAVELRETNRRIREAKEKTELEKYDICGPMPEPKINIDHDDGGGYRNCMRHSFYGRECPTCFMEKFKDDNDR